MPLHTAFFELLNKRGALDAQKLCGLIFYAFCLGQSLVNKAAFNSIKKVLKVQAVLGSTPKVWPQIPRKGRLRLQQRLQTPA